MSAANTDLLKKLSKRWVGQIGAAGVSDNTTTTVPLSSTTNLATDTAVVVTIDRVDANGVATPSLEETVIGVVSGTNLINCIRAAEGTAQSHNAGSVVEVLVTAKGYNDIIDAFLIGHTQLGAHKTITGTRITKRILSATSYTTDTGTSLNCDNLDEFIVTAQAGALLFNNPTGTPVDGQMIMIAVRGTAARALTYGNQFVASTTALPSTTVTTARLNMVFVWSAADSQWIILASV